MSSRGLLGGFGPTLAFATLARCRRRRTRLGELLDRSYMAKMGQVLVRRDEEALCRVGRVVKTLGEQGATAQRRDVRHVVAQKGEGLAHHCDGMGAPRVGGPVGLESLVHKPVQGADKGRSAILEVAQLSISLLQGLRLSRHAIEERGIQIAREIARAIVEESTAGHVVQGTLKEILVHVRESGEHLLGWMEIHARESVLEIGVAYHEGIDIPGVQARLEFAVLSIQLLKTGLNGIEGFSIKERGRHGKTGEEVQCCPCKRKKERHVSFLYIFFSK